MPVKKYFDVEPHMHIHREMGMYKTGEICIRLMIHIKVNLLIRETGQRVYAISVSFFIFAGESTVFLKFKNINYNLCISRN